MKKITLLASALCMLASSHLWATKRGSSLSMPEQGFRIVEPNELPSGNLRTVFERVASEGVRADGETPQAHRRVTWTLPTTKVRIPNLLGSGNRRTQWANLDLTLQGTIIGASRRRGRGIPVEITSYEKLNVALKQGKGPFEWVKASIVPLFEDPRATRTKNGVLRFLSDGLLQITDTNIKVPPTPHHNPVELYAKERFFAPAIRSALRQVAHTIFHTARGK